MEPSPHICTYQHPYVSTSLRVNPHAQQKEWGQPREAGMKVFVDEYTIFNVVQWVRFMTTERVSLIGSCCTADKFFTAPPISHLATKLLRQRHFFLTELPGSTTDQRITQWLHPDSTQSFVYTLRVSNEYNHIF